MIQVSRDIHPSVVTILMERPEKRNALDQALVAGLTDAILQADADDSVRLIVLTGSGKAFSAGADLAALQRLASATLEDNLSDSRALAALFEAIYQAGTPVLARVNGHAIAGGCGLAAVCDFVVAADNAKFGFTEVRIGFVPAIISVYLLERFPEYAIRRAFLAGGLMSAEEARAIGLVSRVVPGAELDSAVAEIAQDLVRNTSGDAVAATKALLRTRFAGTHAARLDEAVRLNAEARGTGECRAGVAAFLEKRPFPWQQTWDSAE